MVDVFELVTESQKQKQFERQQISEKQIQALHDSSPTKTQAIENQT